MSGEPVPAESTEGNSTMVNTEKPPYPLRRHFLRVVASGGALYLSAACFGETGSTRKGSSLLVRGELKSWRSNPALQPLAVAFQFLERPDLAQLPVGKHVISPKAYAMIDKSRSQPPEAVRFEAHRKYVDVHYMISGQVTTGFAPATELKMVTPYNADEDAAEYAVPPKYVHVDLHPGQFAVFFPGGGHMPNCHLDGPHELHKVVVKVEA